MTTSGTVGQTTYDTATVIEHAFRRCKVHPSKQTPEKIQVAKDCLGLLLSSMATRGINLWAVEKHLIGFSVGQAIYQCPVGTVDLLNLIYSTPSQTTGTETAGTNSYKTQLSSATTIVRVGVKMSAVTESDTLTISYSDDDVTYTTAETITKSDWAANTWYWFDLEPQIEATYFRVAFSSTATFSSMYLANQVQDLPITQWSRDTWSVINNKWMQAHPSTNYYYERLIQPQVTLWPIPDVAENHLTMFVHRQIQDVGTLVQTLQLPQRWFEPIVWQLTVRLAFELEDVDPNIISVITQMAENYTIEVEADETDGAPIMMAPTIGVYTR